VRSLQRRKPQNPSVQPDEEKPDKISGREVCFVPKNGCYKSSNLLILPASNLPGVKMWWRDLCRHDYSRFMLNDREHILDALREKPLKAFEIKKRANVVNDEACQALLLKMRDEGLVKFDIHKGHWSIASPR
jgi:hypothetical protein